MKQALKLILIIFLHFSNFCNFNNIVIPNRCQSYEWQCLDGTCIDARQHCDGTPNCLDRSDEENCPGEISINYLRLL